MNAKRLTLFVFILFSFHSDLVIARTWRQQATDMWQRSSSGLSKEMDRFKSSVTKAVGELIDEFKEIADKFLGIRKTHAKVEKDIHQAQEFTEEAHKHRNTVETTESKVEKLGGEVSKKLHSALEKASKAAHTAVRTADKAADDIKKEVSDHGEKIAKIRNKLEHETKKAKKATDELVPISAMELGG